MGKSNNNVIKMPTINLVDQIYQTAIKRQNDIQNRKIKFLFNEAYRYFVDKYVTDIAIGKMPDLPPFMYQTGKAICTWAKHNAQEVMLDVIKDGRVDRCYTARKRELQKAAQ